MWLLPLLLQANRRVLTVVVEIGDGEFAAGGDSRAGVQIKAQNRPVPCGEHIVTLRQGEQPAGHAPS